MPIQVTSVTKRSDSKYVVSVLDTETVKTYSVNFNPSNTLESIVERIKELVAADKDMLSAETVIEDTVKAGIEAIDTSKLGGA